MVDKAGVAGKIIVGADATVGQQFSDDTKSAVYLKQALGVALRCEICGGFLDPNKSVSTTTSRRFGKEERATMKIANSPTLFATTLATLCKVLGRA